MRPISASVVRSRRRPLAATKAAAASTMATAAPVATCADVAGSGIVRLRRERLGATEDTAAEGGTGGSEQRGDAPAGGGRDPGQRGEREAGEDDDQRQRQVVAGGVRGQPGRAGDDRAPVDLDRLVTAGGGLGERLAVGLGGRRD